MGYEAGIASNDQDLLEFVAHKYREAGHDFDAGYAVDQGIIYNMCGWVMSDVSRDVLAASVGKGSIADAFGDEWELDVVPVSVLRELTDAYDAFAATSGGKRILACDELEIEYMVGNADTDVDERDPGTVFISPEAMAQAMDALGSTGHGEALEALLDEYWRIGSIEGMSEVLDWIEEHGSDTVLWYESY